MNADLMDDEVFKNLIRDPLHNEESTIQAMPLLIRKKEDRQNLIDAIETKHCKSPTDIVEYAWALAEKESVQRETIDDAEKRNTLYRDELRKTLKTYRDDEKWLNDIMGLIDTEDEAEELLYAIEHGWANTPGEMVIYLARIKNDAPFEDEEET
ncbi:hypothetical protein [Megasphaera hominis]|jgi:hypothetical protein|uniref:Uncharacterized protein n=3 Tax=Megasphaera TaxID=906 RepID=A0ABR6VKQ3_9FIRM|nr:hypothetical protein [Megasphaera hominis]MBC3537733.1 hypothetical protein [Megasphaera hominis]